jgi:phosphatidate cytidylyltransferase
VVRVLSALVMIPLVIATIWFLPPALLLTVAEAILLIAFVEYAGLTARIGIPIPKIVSGTAAGATCAACGWPGAPVEVPLIAALVALGTLVLAQHRPDTSPLQSIAAALFASIYLGVPFGALVAIRTRIGREALLLLILTVIASDSAQYYSGRLFGRRLLAPAISPKKTVEGFVGGLVCGSVAMVLLGRLWLPQLGAVSLVLLGAFVVTLGVVGDLFESLLKRSASVKDSGGLIPGHGGILDRIDALLFAAPGYYVFVRFGA